MLRSFFNLSHPTRVSHLPLQDGLSYLKVNKVRVQPRLLTNLTHVGPDSNLIYRQGWTPRLPLIKYPQKKLRPKTDGGLRRIRQLAGIVLASFEQIH